MIWLLLLLSFFDWNAHAVPALAPQPTPEEAYGEAYTAVASLEDGSFVLAQLMFTNAGVGSKKAARRVLWVPPSKAGINASERFGPNWSFDAESNRLTAGTCSLWAKDSSILFSAHVPGLAIDLNIESALQRVQPPGNQLQIKNTFYEAELLVPYANVSAEISSGAQTLRTKGAVHLDHSRSNLLMPNAAACWIRFRGFFGSKPTLLQVRVPPDGGTVDGWIWPLNAAVPAALDGNQVSRTATESGLPALSIGDTALPVQLDANRQLYRYRPTESYGALGKLASPWIGDPTTTTYRAKATIGDGTAKGILEVLEVDEPGCGFQ